MDKLLVDNYIAILKEEMVPALGCTEPIVIAYAAAKAREVLDRFPSRAILECSGNIIKNVKSVTVPNAGGLKGLQASMLAGLVGGEASRKLEVLAAMTPEHVSAVKRLLVDNFCEVKLLDTDIKLHLLVHLWSENEQVTVEIKHIHTNISKIKKMDRLFFIMKPPLINT